MRDLYHLSALDHRILALLQERADVSQAELAQRVGSSPASCWRRIRALEDAGVLTRSVRLVDPAKLGWTVNVLCHLRVRSHAREVRASFESFVQSRPEVMECYSMSGEWDYLLRVVAKGVSEYEDFLMHTLLDHPSVGGASSHFALSQTKYITSLPTEAH